MNYDDYNRGYKAGCRRGALESGLMLIASVAWLYEHDRAELADEFRQFQDPLLATPEWNETPLYTHPPDTPVAYEKAALAARDTMLENYHSHFEGGGCPHDGDAQIECVTQAIRSLAEGVG